MKTTPFKLTALALLCLPAVLLSNTAMANDNDITDGPVTRFIIKYKESPAADISAALPQSMGQQVKAQRMAEKAERF